MDSFYLVWRQWDNNATETCDPTICCFCKRVSNVPQQDVIGCFCHRCYFGLISLCEAFALGCCCELREETNGDRVLAGVIYVCIPFCRLRTQKSRHYNNSSIWMIKCSCRGMQVSSHSARAYILMSYSDRQYMCILFLDVRHIYRYLCMLQMLYFYLSPLLFLCSNPAYFP